MREKYFSTDLWIQNVDYAKSLKNLDTLVDTFEGGRDIIKAVDSWHTEFKVSLF